MCFSPTASFFAAGVLGSIGIATLRHVHEPRTALFGAMPLLFALHQLSEGFVWLGLKGVVGPNGLHAAAFLFTFYAQGVLPTLVPAAVALMEPRDGRRAVFYGLVAVGALVSAWDLYGLLFYPSRVFLDHHAIAYRNPLTGNFGISLLYIGATCGALLASSHRTIRWYGVLNIVGLTVVQLAREYAFASIWCFYAAALSVMIYWQFLRQRISISVFPGG